MQYLISLFQQPKHHKYLPWQPSLHTATKISALKLKKMFTNRLLLQYLQIL